MSNLDILWSRFVETYGRDGAAALLGNIRAESAYNPKNLQNSYEKKLGFTDDTYTAAVDSGAYSRDKFAHDSAGYGLCQWTHYSRKQNLYDYAKSHNSSIGDINMQAAFCIFEIEAYKLTDTLRSNISLRDKVAAVLRKYEKPADQSEANVDRRTKYAQDVLNAYPVGAVTPSTNYSAIASELKDIASRLNSIAYQLEK